MRKDEEKMANIVGLDLNIDQDYLAEAVRQTVIMGISESLNGNKETGAWTKKCYEEAQKPETTIVLLIPARTDRASFHDYVLGKAEIRFIRGRLKFERGGKALAPAPFPSMICIWRYPWSLIR